VKVSQHEKSSVVPMRPGKQIGKGPVEKIKKGLGIK
jgi:predicted RNA binding protein YcfA (HicA-like mRNA interferase family)